MYALVLSGGNRELSQLRARRDGVGRRPTGACVSTVVCVVFGGAPSICLRHHMENLVNNGPGWM